MKRMARFSTLSLAIGIMMLVFGNGTMHLTAQEDAGKKKQDGLVVDWINDFENCEDWRAVATSPLGDTKTRKIPGKPRPMNEQGQPVNEEGQAGEFKNETTDENGITRKNENVLGIKTYFAERGFDRVEAFPPNEYIIRGKARELKF
ncbi:MAG: hypothetical protein E4G96_07285, partial [Chrysiogenales bacterium]